jgi:integrase/recombinase XerD
MQQTEVKLWLDTRSEKINKTYPIKVRLRHKRKYDPIGLSSEFSVNLDGWNKNKREIRASVENAGRLRVKCKNKLDIAQKVIDDNQSLLESLSVGQLGDMIRKALSDPADEPKLASIEDVNKHLEKHLTLREWTTNLIERQEKRKKWKTGKWYKDGVDAFLDYYGSDDLQLRHITVSMMEDFKAVYQGRGLKDGGLNTRLRALRSVLNKAVKEGKMNPEHNPFMIFNPTHSKVQIPTGKPEKRAVDATIVSAFKKLFLGGQIEVNREGQEVEVVTLKPFTSDWHCIAEGLFMWESWAMNFIDLVKLKVRHVIGNDTIVYKRSKTDSPAQPVISKLAYEIAQYYAEGKSPEDYLFRYKWLDTKLGYDRYEQQRKRWNKRMTQLASKLGYENVDFTTYVLRHTFATHLNSAGVLQDFIGQMFSHIDPRSIKTYCKDQSPQVLAEKANAALVNI